jgi:hypothetical protein
MFGSCHLANYLLTILITLSNMLTMFSIYPIILEFLKTYENIESDLLLGLYIGVK